MKITDLKVNPQNPRLIKDEKFKKLCKSIKEFPKMMELRPIIIDTNNVILGGNMRFRALKELGYTELEKGWVKVADKLTEAEQRRFIVEDNIGFGDWDWDNLANNFEKEELADWGIDEAELMVKFGLNAVDEVEIDDDRLFVLTVNPPEAPRLKEKMAFYCENVEDYNLIKDMFGGSHILDVDKLLSLIK